ncbi:MAG: thiol:disulfide interchange protein DsbA/DsbL [Succinivibrio sp.]|nr:thiol:disulfide interchange protein DsbA/DsbL [Succinivibrio sp.]
MLGKFLRILGVVAAILWCFGASAQTGEEKQYTQGVDYEVRGTAKSEKPSVREFFSFWCGHCYMMQEPFAVLAKHLKGKAEFLPTPVSILGGEMGIESQKSYVIARMHGIEELYASTLFEKIHVKDEIPSSHEDFVTLFKELGVAQDEFDKEFVSFPVTGAASKIDSLTESLGIDAVPEIVVNDKYLVLMEKLETVGDLLNVIDYLLTLP